jgi:polysaccharide pyruvyl transferase WcaK-like protein
MANVLLVGAFGQRNSGDEALCAVISRALDDHEVTIASRDPDLTQMLHGRRAIPATPLDTQRELRRADLVVVGGGTIFKSLHPSSGRHGGSLLVQTLGLLALAQVHRVPVAFVGVGAGAVRGAMARSLARRVARRAHMLVLRDEESAAVLAEIGVAPPFWIGADPAWALFRDGLLRCPAPGRVSPGAPGMRRVTVAISHLADDDWSPSGRSSATPSRVDRLGAALAGLAERGWQVRLQTWQQGSHDLAVAEALRIHVPDATVEPVPHDLTAAARSFIDDELVIAMRFHALVAAAAAGRPTVAVAHEPKLAGLARRLDQLAVPPDASTAVFTEAFDRAVEHGAPPQHAVDEQIELAARTLRLMQLVVDEGRLDRPEEMATLSLSTGEVRW